MGLFHRNRTALTPEPPAVAGLSEVLAPRGWRPLTGTPFDGHLEDKIHDLSRAMYGVPRGINTAQVGLRVGGTVFRDSFGTRVAGHDVVITNAWTEIETEYQQAKVEWHGAAVCALPLPALLPLDAVQSRLLHPVVHTQPVPTGDPQFDSRFVTSGDPRGLPDLLTSDVRARMLARDDWSFVCERYWLGCVTQPGFHSAEEILQRVDDVLAVVAALPENLVPAQMDHSADDLAARIEALTGLEEAMSFLQGLTEDDRQRLAASGSPFAAFADVRTPQEAIARMQALPPAQKMQFMALFMRVRDQHRR